MNYAPGKQRLRHTFHLGPASNEVCKQNFMETLAIGPSYIRGVIHRRDPLTGVVREYQRGKSMINFN